jgi:tRNA G18 (ribose-2'-O)-methylase SpoU
MATIVAVDDPGDERLGEYVTLTDGELRRRAGTFVCEGVLVVRKAVAAGATLRSVLVTPTRLGAIADVVEPLDIPVYVAQQTVMDAVVGFRIHRGVVAVATRPAPRSLPDLLATARTVAVLEGVNDHENLGALFRNAAAFDVDAVLLDAACADPLYRRSVRVSLGHVLGVPHGRVADWAAGMTALRDHGFSLVALTPDPSAEPVTRIGRAGRVAFLLGAEGSGLSPGALASADRRVRIAMAPGVDSLNVATAAAIAFHHRFGG